MRTSRIVAVAFVLLLLASAPLGSMPKHGGAAVITFNNDLTTLDPHVGYDWQNWSVIKSIFDGLMDYKPGTTELEPDLAESYTVSEDGRTWSWSASDLFRGDSFVVRLRVPLAGSATPVAAALTRSSVQSASPSFSR